MAQGCSAGANWFNGLLAYVVQEYTENLADAGITFFKETQDMTLG